MHAKGGLYLDVDVECFMPTDKLLSDSDIVLQLEDTNPKSLNNAVMAGVPGHPFWLDVIQIMMDRGSRANAGFLGFRQLDTILKTTGMLPHQNGVQLRLPEAAMCKTLKQSTTSCKSVMYTLASEVRLSVLLSSAEAVLKLTHIFCLACAVCDSDHAKLQPWQALYQTNKMWFVVQDLTPYGMHSKGSRMKLDPCKMPGPGGGM